MARPFKQCRRISSMYLGAPGARESRVTQLDILPTDLMSEVLYVLAQGEYLTQPLRADRFIEEWHRPVLSLDLERKVTAPPPSKGGEPFKPTSAAWLRLPRP